MTHQRLTLGVAVAVFACMVGASTPLPAQSPEQAGRTLEVSFNDGRVTIVAANVTVREILAEWGRKGGSRIVNAEKLTGQPIPYLEFRNQPEAAVLRSLLIDAPGYGAAPRIAPAPDASTVDAVFILPTRTVAVSNAPVPSPVQQLQQGGQRQVPILAPEDFQQAPPSSPTPRIIPGTPDAEIPPVQPVQGDLPPSTPPNPTAANPTLRTGPGGTVTSTIPGVVIGGTPPPATGRGGGGGGGSLR